MKECTKQNLYNKKACEFKLQEWIKCCKASKYSERQHIQYSGKTFSIIANKEARRKECGTSSHSETLVKEKQGWKKK